MYRRKKHLSRELQEILQADYLDIGAGAARISQDDVSRSISAANKE
jgi:hypothetical protein